MRIGRTVTIKRPLEEVFAFMSDAENERYWRTNVKSIERVGEGKGSGVGTEYKQTLKGPFGGFTADIRYTEFEPRKRVTFETIRGSVRPSATTEFSAAGENATTVEFEMTWEPTGPFRLLKPLIAPILRKQMDANFDNLVRHLEAREDERDSAR